MACIVNRPPVPPCGKCLPCRNRLVRQWQARAALEELVSGPAHMITVTYADENLRYTASGLPTLDKKALENWKVRHLIPLLLRLAPLENPRIVIFGEYGRLTGRPHYHLVVFSCLNPLVLEHELRQIWERGHVDVTSSDNAGPNFAKYLFSDMFKTKLTEAELLDREKEFKMTPRKPTLGMPGIKKIADVYRSEKGQQSFADQNRDIRPFVRIGGVVRWLGVWGERMLRQELGIPIRRSDRQELGMTTDKIIVATDELTEKMNRKLQAYVNRRKRTYSI